jgi:hypothetical protein
MSDAHSLLEGQILTSPLFNEPMRVETARGGADDSWTVGLVGTQTERFRKVTLTAEDLASLIICEPGFGYDGGNGDTMASILLSSNGSMVTVGEFGNCWSQGTLCRC